MSPEAAFGLAITSNVVNAVHVRGVFGLAGTPRPVKLGNMESGTSINASNESYPDAFLEGKVIVNYPRPSKKVQAKWLSVGLELVETVPTPRLTDAFVKNMHSSAGGTNQSSTLEIRCDISPGNTLKNKEESMRKLTPCVNNNSRIVTCQHNARIMSSDRQIAYVQEFPESMRMIWANDTQGKQSWIHKGHQGKFHAGAFDFEIPLPRHGGTTVARAKGTPFASEYRVVATLCYRAKRGRFKWQTVFAKTCLPVHLIWHPNLQHWPYYSPRNPHLIPIEGILPWHDSEFSDSIPQGQVRTVYRIFDDSVLWMDIVREHGIFGPGDTIYTFVIVGTYGFNCDMTLKDISLRLMSSATVKHAIALPPSKQTCVHETIVAQSSDPVLCPVNLGFFKSSWLPSTHNHRLPVTYTRGQFPNAQFQAFQLHTRVPNSRALATVAGPHLSIEYSISVEASFDNLAKLSCDPWAITLTGVPSHESQALVAAAGHINPLSLSAVKWMSLRTVAFMMMGTRAIARAQNDAFSITDRSQIVHSESRDMANAFSEEDADKLSKRFSNHATPNRATLRGPATGIPETIKEAAVHRPSAQAPDAPLNQKETQRCGGSSPTHDLNNPHARVSSPKESIERQRSPSPRLRHTGQLRDTQETPIGQNAQRLSLSGSQPQAIPGHIVEIPGATCTGASPLFAFIPSAHAYKGDNTSPTSRTQGPHEASLHRNSPELAAFSSLPSPKVSSPRASPRILDDLPHVLRAGQNAPNTEAARATRIPRPPMPTSGAPGSRYKTSLRTGARSYSRIPSIPRLASLHRGSLDIESLIDAYGAHSGPEKHSRTGQFVSHSANASLTKGRRLSRLSTTGGKGKDFVEKRVSNEQRTKNQTGRSPQHSADFNSQLPYVHSPSLTETRSTEKENNRETPCVEEVPLRHSRVVTDTVNHVVDRILGHDASTIDPLRLEDSFVGVTDERNSQQIPGHRQSAVEAMAHYRLSSGTNESLNALWERNFQEPMPRKHVGSLRYRRPTEEVEIWLASIPRNLFPDPCESKNDTSPLQTDGVPELTAGSRSLSDDASLPSAGPPPRESLPSLPPSQDAKAASLRRPWSDSSIYPTRIASPRQSSRQSRAIIPSASSETTCRTSLETLKGSRRPSSDPFHGHMKLTDNRLVDLTSPASATFHDSQMGNESIGNTTDQRIKDAVDKMALSMHDSPCSQRGVWSSRSLLPIDEGCDEGDSGSMSPSLVFGDNSEGDEEEAYSFLQEVFGSFPVPVQSRAL